MDSKSFLKGMALAIVSFSVLMSSCTGKVNRAKQIEDSIRNRQIDSTVVARIKMPTKPVWAMIDSLEKAKAVSTQRIAYYRALAYYREGNRKESEKYLVKALNGRALLAENRELFYRAADLLSSSMINRHENKKALAVLTLGFEAAKVDQTVVGRRWVALLLNGMGYCEMQLGHINEAERYFSQAYIGLKQLVDVDPQYGNIQDYVRVSNNILDAYTSTGSYKKAAAWLESAKEAVDLLIASPQCSAYDRQSALGGLYLQQAIVLLHSGKREQADAVYAKAVRLGYCKTGEGIVECALYLKEAERWEELERLLPQADSVYTSWGDPEAARQLRLRDSKTFHPIDVKTN